MDGNQWIALAGVLTGALGLAIPAFMRFSDRKHEHKTWVRDRRAETYYEALALISASASFDENEEHHAMKAKMAMWASGDVRKSFDDWYSKRHMANDQGANDYATEYLRLEAEVEQQIRRDLNSDVR